MAGETIKQEAVCLGIHPWSRTSHVVSWLTPSGRVTTIVKGAVRPKSWFLGQYDLNYTCEIVYYARGTGDLHALRECVPVNRRDALRDDYRSLALAGYCRRQVEDFAPSGPEGDEWKNLLERTLDAVADDCQHEVSLTARMVAFETEVLALSGLAPDFSGYDRGSPWSSFSIEKGAFGSVSGRILRVSLAVARCLCNPENEKNPQILLDAARVIGVFYHFSLDSAPDVRRSVLAMLQKNC